VNNAKLHLSQFLKINIRIYFRKKIKNIKINALLRKFNIAKNRLICKIDNNYKYWKKTLEKFCN